MSKRMFNFALKLAQYGYGSAGTVLLDYISQNRVEVIKASTFFSPANGILYHVR